MSWNYRVMEKTTATGESEFGVYEVYYDDKGKIKGYSEKSVTPVAETESELAESIGLIKEAFSKETLIYE